MERALVWIGGDAKGWACSKCRWKFPVPTLLTGEEAKGAYDRLAAAKFREHTCEAGTSFLQRNRKQNWTLAFLSPSAPGRLLSEDTRRRLLPTLYFMKWNSNTAAVRR